MRTSEAIRRLSSCAEPLRAAGITALHVFGSTATGRARADSDLDVFVDHEDDAGFSLFDLVGVKLLIEEQLGVSADVTTRGGLHPMLREQIERSAIRVF